MIDTDLRYLDNKIISESFGGRLTNFFSVEEDTNKQLRLGHGLIQSNSIVLVFILMIL